MTWFIRREILGAHLKSNKNGFAVEDGGWGWGVVSGKKKVNTCILLSSHGGNLR